MKKMIAAILMCLALTGCANLQFQFSMSYATDNLMEELRAAKQTEQAK
jgi:hypothetical protein